MSSKAKRRKVDIQQDRDNPLVDDDKEFLLPELLKMVLTKAVLVQMYSEDMAKRQSDESIFDNLASVDFLWWNSMKKYNLRNKIRHISKVYFQKAKTRSKIINNNQYFLKEVIQPDRIIFPMESCGCLTENEARFLRRLRNDKDKNHEILIMLQDVSSQKYSKMIDCLFLANQTPAALVLERGGEAVKVHISNGKASGTKEFEMEFIERFKRMQKANTLIFNDLLNASVRIRLNDVFILHAKQNKGIELWFWCKTEPSLNQLKSLSDDDLREIIQQIYQRLIPEHKITLKPELIQMNYSLASDFAERRLSIRRVKDYDNLNVFPVNGRKCRSCHIFKVEPELDNKVSQWLSEAGVFLISVTSKGDVLVLQVESEDNMLRIFTPEGTVKRTISMKDYRLFQIKFIQEIIPGVVAVAYRKLGSAHMYIGIMSLDEGGTIFRHIECQQKISSLTLFRYGDMFIGDIGRTNGADDLFDDVDDDVDLDDYGYVYDNYFGIVRLHQWPLKSKVTRDLLMIDEKIYSMHFAADQKQLYVLTSQKLEIYELKCEDENYYS